jgi:hypothetical protein
MLSKFSIGDNVIYFNYEDDFPIDYKPIDKSKPKLKNNELSGDSTFPFGKYKGIRISDFVDDAVDIQYLKWWVDNVTTHTFTNDIYPKIEKLIKNDF